MSNLDARNLNDKGVALSRQGNLEAALTAFDESIGLDPQDGLTHYNKGDTLYEMGRYNEAVKAYDAAISIGIGVGEIDAASYVGKGNALLALKQYVEALTVFTEAVRIYPEESVAYNGSGNALHDLGQYE